MQQVARNLTDPEGGALLGQRFLLHDRDTKFCSGFRSIVRDAGVEPLRLPAELSRPERIRGTVGTLCKTGVSIEDDSAREASLRRALNEYLAHFHAERPHQGKGNVLAVPRAD